MGSGPKIKTIILLTFAFILYVIHVIFAGLASRGINEKLFPQPMGNTSYAFKMLITPVSSTFSIRILIYVFQFAWMLFAYLSNCSSGSATNLLSGKFYLCFIVSTIFVTIWLFTWTRMEAITSLIIVILHQVFIELAFGFACSDLREYLQTRDVERENRVSVWCHRILVQNGILFYLTWTAVASLIVFSVTLHRELEVSDQAASLAALIILAVLLLAYFYCENFVFENYTTHTIACYIALIWALSGVFRGVWGKNDVIGGMTLALLIVAVVLLVARFVIIVIRSRRRDSYDSIGYNSDKQTLTT